LKTDITQVQDTEEDGLKLIEVFSKYNILEIYKHEFSRDKNMVEIVVTIIDDIDNGINKTMTELKILAGK
jgi:hypothetical protein